MDRWILIIKHLIMVICDPPNHICTLLILPPRLFPILFFVYFMLLHGKASSDDAKQACTKIFLVRALSNHMHFLFLFLFATELAHIFIVVQDSKAFKFSDMPKQYKPIFDTYSTIICPHPLHIPNPFKQAMCSPK